MFDPSLVEINTVAYIEISAGFNSGTIQVPIKIKNPCVDPAFVQILAPGTFSDNIFLASPTGEQTITWTHDPFVISGDPDIVSKCPPLVYEPTINGETLPSLNYPSIVYNETTLTFTDIGGNDLSGYDYGIQAYFEGYDPDVILTGVFSEEIAIVTLSDPCATPNSVTITGTPDVLISDYSGPVTWNFPSYVIDPAGCTPIFSCTYISGASPIPLDLCDFTFNNPPYLSQGSLNTQTGSYTFQSDDLIFFPPGNYNF